MQTNNSLKIIITISLLLLIVSIGIFYTQRIVQQHLLQQSEIAIELLSYDPGLQPASITDIEQLPNKKWLNTTPKNYNNLYIKQSLWERIIIHNTSNKDKIIVISDKGNYVTEHTIHSELETHNVNMLFGNEHFRQQFTLPARTQTTIYIEKQGYQLNNFSTQVLDYPTYRLAQLLSIICSTWAYGAILGVAVFYILTITSRQTQFSERVAIFAYIATTILVIAVENNLHSIITIATPTAESIGQKISLPLILAPLSSYILLRSYSISNKRHPLYQLSIVFFVATVLLAYCLINNYIVPVIYIGFTIIAFVHQFYWLHYASQSTQLNEIGKVAAIAFILTSIANHVYVIALSSLPELTNARMHVINAYYLLCIAAAISMLNDKNIIAFMQNQQIQDTKLRIAKNQATHQEVRSISNTIDTLLERAEALLKNHAIDIAKAINNLRLLQLEASWRRQFINLTSFRNLMYTNYAKGLIQKKNAKPSTEQTFYSFIKLLASTSKSKVISEEQSLLNNEDASLTLTANHTNQTILIIDDNNSAAALTAKALQNTNYNIEIFTNPLYAIQYCQIKTSLNNGECIKAIISDYEMPELNGIETLQQINTLHEISNIKTPKLIIFSSASKKIKKTNNITIIDKTKASSLITAIDHA